jgi:hypothetical protein
VLVLLAMSVFAVVQSQLTDAAAEEAVAARSVSEDYWRAATAVAAEESLERKYRLEPGEAVRVRFDQSAAALIAALGEVQRDGDVSDRLLVYEVMQQHGVYLEAIGRLFAAIDRGDVDVALRIDADDTDPVFGVMEAAILGAAAAKHERALVALQELESVTRGLTPVVFLAGLLLAGLLASITTGPPAPADRTITRAALAGDQPAVAGLVVVRPGPHFAAPSAAPRPGSVAEWAGGLQTRQAAITGGVPPCLSRTVALSGPGYRARRG